VSAASESRAHTELASTPLPRATGTIDITDASPSGAADVTRPSPAPLGRLDLERQTVDLRGVVDVDEVLLGHQLDLRIAQDSHAVFFDGFPVVRDHVFGRLAHVLDYDLGHRPHPTLACGRAPMRGRPFLGRR
jgi:hypothetical protein